MTDFGDATRPAFPCAIRKLPVLPGSRFLPVLLARAAIVAAVALAVLATCLTAPAKAQQLSWPPEVPLDTLPVYQTPRPEYAALGITFGSFLFKPVASHKITYDDNIFASDVRKDLDLVNTVTEDMTFASQWSRHFLTLDLHSDQEIYAFHPQENANTNLAHIAARYDLTESSFLQLDGIGGQEPDLRANPVALRTDERPIYNNWGGTLNYFQRFGLFVEQFQMGINQVDYLQPQEIFLSYVAESYGDRLSFDHGGPLVPFIEVSYVPNNQKFHPDKQSFQNLTGLTGIHAHIASVLDAEIEAGLLRETYNNPDFDPLFRPVVAGKLLWNATPLTSVIAAVGRTYSGVESFCNSVPPICQIDSSGNVESVTSLASSSSATFETHRSSLEATTLKLALQHEIWHNLLGEVDLEYIHDVFDLNNLVDNIYTVAGNMRYLINRNAEVEASYQYRERFANLPHDFTFNSGPYAENILSFSVKLKL